MSNPNTDHSLATQAVLDAIEGIENPQWIAQAAIRAAVKQTQFRQYGTCYICEASRLLLIAHELGVFPESPADQS
jgi:hypothetical protein